MELIVIAFLLMFLIYEIDSIIELIFKDFAKFMTFSNWISLFSFYLQKSS